MKCNNYIQCGPYNGNDDHSWHLMTLCHCPHTVLSASHVPHNVILSRKYGRSFDARLHEFRPRFTIYSAVWFSTSQLPLAPCFLHLKNGNNNSSYLTGSPWKWKVHGYKMPKKVFGSQGVLSKCWLFLFLWYLFRQWNHYIYVRFKGSTLKT